MTTESTEQIADGLILCYLTDDWQSRIIDGPKNKGGTLFFRYGITATSYGWALTEFRKGTPPIGRVHASRFQDLVPSFKTEAGLNPIDTIKVCQKSLELIANIKPEFKTITGTNLEQAMNLAEQIDELYETNFNIHDNVRNRYFGKNEEEE